TININPVNDAPLGANSGISVGTGATFTFGAANFAGLTDPTELAANMLAGVVITGLPNGGALNFNGNPISTAQAAAGFPVSLADLNARSLTFDATGVGPRTITR